MAVILIWFFVLMSVFPNIKYSYLNSFANKQTDKILSESVSRNQFLQNLLVVPSTQELRFSFACMTDLPYIRSLVCRRKYHLWSKVFICNSHSLSSTFRLCSRKPRWWKVSDFYLWDFFILLVLVAISLLKSKIVISKPIANDTHMQNTTNLSILWTFYLQKFY